MKLVSIPILLSLPASTLSYPGGRCSHRWDDNLCICLDRLVCASYGGVGYEGVEGAYPCPYDTNNVIGCYIWDNCPGHDSSTGCVWTGGCTRGTHLTGEL